MPERRRRLVSGADVPERGRRLVSGADLPGRMQAAGTWGHCSCRSAWPCVGEFLKISTIQNQHNSPQQQTMVKVDNGAKPDRHIAPTDEMK